MQTLTVSMRRCLSEVRSRRVIHFHGTGTMRLDGVLTLQNLYGNYNIGAIEVNGGGAVTRDMYVDTDNGSEISINEDLTAFNVTNHETLRVADGKP